MEPKELLENSRKLARKYRVTDGDSFRLKDFDPDDTGELTSEDKPRAQEVLQYGIQAMSELQDKLYAQDRWAVLAIFQAMDAAGKDGAIRHVMSGVNPQGCQVASFKGPSSQELDHDYLWRCMRELPERGRIGIFNRSYYEEVLIVRVHADLLAKQKIPATLVDDDIWKHRYEDIRWFERYLARNGTRFCKIFLNVSRKEQKKRFLARLEDPDKLWKFSSADLAERALWKDYMDAYEKMIRGTATEDAPWYVIPADAKWFTRIVVAAVMVDTLHSLDLSYPEPSKAQRADAKKLVRQLEAE